MCASSLRLRRALAGLALVALSAAAPPPAAAKKAPPAPAPPPRLAKLATVLSLEDRRSTGGGTLEALLHDPDRGVRRRAALAAGRVADPSLVPALVGLMNDGEVEIRRVAAFALGLAGDRRAVDRLLAALGDSDSVVRGRAAEALGRIGDPRAAPAIAKLVVDALPKTISRMTVRGDEPGNPADTWAEQRLALFALARLRDPAAAAPALLDGDRPRFDWWAATWVAMRLESPALRPVLLAACDSTDPVSRALAARGLGATKDAAAGDVLLRLVRDPDETVALNALRALAAIGEPRGDRRRGGAPRLAERHAAARGPARPRRRCRPTPRFVHASCRSWPSATRSSAPPRSVPSPERARRTSRSSSRGSTPTPTSACARPSPAPWARPEAT